MGESVWPFCPRSSLHRGRAQSMDRWPRCSSLFWSEGFLSQATHYNEKLAEEVWFPSSGCSGMKLSTSGCGFAPDSSMAIAALGDSHPILQPHASFFLLFGKNRWMDLLWGETKGKKNAALCLKQIYIPECVSNLAHQPRS